MKTNLRKSSPVLQVILSVLCAIALWLYVMSVESPIYTETFYGVPVELRNETVLTQNGLSVLSGYGFTVDLTVTGKRSLITQMESEDLVAYADLGTITGTGEYALEIKTEMREGVTVNEISENTVPVYADTTTSKTIIVSQEISYYGGVTAGTGYSMGKPYIMPTTTMPDVTSTVIKGPVSVLNAVDHARVKAVDLGAITGSVTFNTVLELIDSAGEVIGNQYISIVNSSVTVYFPVVTEKEVSVEPVFSEAFTSADYAIGVSPSKVTVRGEEAILRNIDRLTVAISGSPEEHIGSEEFDLTVQGVEIVDGTDSVSVSVRKNATKSKQATE